VASGFIRTKGYAMRIAGTVVVLAAAALMAGPVFAQSLDPRWTPWLGCWKLSGEPVRVCAAPSADGRSVTLSTYVDGAGAESRTPVLEQTLVADGARYAVAEAECRGHQSAEWSATGQRLFARAELTCSDGAARTVSGLSMIAAADVWIDIQGVDVGGREMVRVRRYERAGTQVRLPFDFAQGTPSERRGVTPDAADGRLTYDSLPYDRLTLDEVIEAASRVSARVVEAALVETRAGFNLSGSVLRRLQRAGLAPGVIDTMVALSYPRHFIVDRPDASASGGFAPVDPLALDKPWYAGWAYPQYGSYWDPFWSPYVYAPFGYAYWASYGGSFPYSPYGPATGFVRIDGAEREGAGRVVNGVGYTRIRERDVVERSEGGGDSGVSSGRSGGGASGLGGWGGAGASPGGYSSGGAAGDGGGRTAQPR
jgi:hypothetical protein